MRTTLLAVALAVVPILGACRSTPSTVRDPARASSTVTADERIAAARQPFDARDRASATNPCSTLSPSSGSPT
jgi:hypothetical protein